MEIKGSGDGDLLIGRYSGGSAKLIYGYQSGADGYLELRTGADSTITKLSGYSGTASYFLSNVGVGTSSPQTLLNVNLGAGNATYGTPAIQIGGTSNYDSLTMGIKGSYDAFIATYGNDLHIYGGNWKSTATATENHNIYFYTSQNGSTNWNTAKAMLRYDGNFGIGTTSPTRNLDINGDVRMLKGSNAINFTSSWSSTPDAPATTVSEISNDTSGYQRLMIIGNRSGGVDRRVGIWDRLAIAGGDYTYVLSVTGNIYASGDIIAYSDARVKTDLEVIKNPIEKIQKIKGITFRRTDSDDPRRYAGVLAQDVLEVLPETVYTNSNGNYSVAYGNMSALLIEAIKEQQTQIESQKSQNEELIKRIETLESILQNKGI